jgi:hypothetical protein
MPKNARRKTVTGAPQGEAPASLRADAALRLYVAERPDGSLRDCWEAYRWEVLNRTGADPGAYDTLDEAGRARFARLIASLGDTHDQDQSHAHEQGAAAEEQDEAGV